MIESEALEDGVWGEPEPISVRRDVTISVRFSADEIEALRNKAASAGMKVTAFIRQAALSIEADLDTDKVRRAVAAAAADLDRATRLLRGAA